MSSVVKGLKENSVPAGDGTNDVFASLCVDSGTVTGVSGLDVVTEVVDTASTDDDLVKTVSVTCTVCCISCTAHENTAPVSVTKPVRSTSGVSGSVSTRIVTPVDAGATASVASNVICVSHIKDSVWKNE